ncbi:MAG: efflux RND transporter periplasmic adaptor subunit [Gemmatimonadota bacterium]|nr:MAG: efflux RND transporter periplasmic adaptor subunit [Gemmatimonadota bacterium]
MKDQIMKQRALKYSAVAGLGLFLVGCARGEADTADEANGAVQVGARIVNVEVTPVSVGEFTGFIRITGEVEALNDITVAAEITGRVMRFMAEKGDRVRRGQAIAQLDDAFLSAQVGEAQAAAQLALEEWERQRQLWEEDSVGTELMYLQRKYQAEIARARLEQLQSRLERTVISAPVTGVFDDNFLELGEMATPGTPVVRVVSTDRVKVIAGVPERYARSVQRGDSTIVTFDIFPGREFVGLVNFVGTSVDPSSRTFPIEILLDNPEGIMKPAMVANVRVQRERLSGVLVVPQHVVLRSADGYKVFIVSASNGDHVAAARTVVLGPTSGNRVVIEQGLEVGDLLITVGHQLVDDGSRVRVVNEEQLGSTEGMD